MKNVALIPAYNPEPGLAEIVKPLLDHFKAIVIVDDGSKAELDPIFQACQGLSEKVHVLHHAVNLGKGAALKTGFNYVLRHHSDCQGVVTLDADGQHLTDDILRVSDALSSHPQDLVIGVRHFDKKVPLRSKIGNVFTKHIFSLLTGMHLKDTQSGLRGIPFTLLPVLMKIQTNGYEFELDMLITAQKHEFDLFCEPIQTVYINGNHSSHFRPLRDSVKIYFVLFRFSIIALLSAFLDYAIFIGLYYFVTNNIMICLASGRVISTAFNYVNVKRYAFHSHGSHRKTLPKYILLAVTSLLLAYTLIIGLISFLNLHVVIAKLISELFMFLVNFLVQRDFIFRRPHK